MPDHPALIVDSTTFVLAANPRARVVFCIGEDPSRASRYLSSGNGRITASRRSRCAGGMGEAREVASMA